jgi:hypothetical protein
MERKETQVQVTGAQGAARSPFHPDGAQGAAWGRAAHQGGGAEEGADPWALGATPAADRGSSSSRQGRQQQQTGAAAAAAQQQQQTRRNNQPAGVDLCWSLLESSGVFWSLLWSLLDPSVAFWSPGHQSQHQSTV